MNSVFLKNVIYNFTFRNNIKLVCQSYCFTKGQTRNYARWSHRKPVKVILPEKLQELQKNANADNESLQNEIQTKLRNKIDMHMNDVQELERSEKVKEKKQPVQQKKVKTTDMLETVIDEEGNFVYTKLQNNDPRVGILLTNLKSKKELNKRELILLEGKRLIIDALEAGCKLKYILFSRKDDVEELKSKLPKRGAKLYKMPYREMQLWSDLATTPGLMGVFKTPNVENYKSISSIPLKVICDNIREPGNLGAILRASAACGCEEVILTKGCVGLWDLKVIRAAAGSHFHLKITHKNFNDIKEEFRGNEKIVIADNKVVVDSKETTMNELKGLIDNVPLIPYYSMAFSRSDNIYLIIGGETHGISLDSYLLAKEQNGVRLNIPLENNVNSLNSGTALGIISFEIKRQLLNVASQ